MGKVTYYEPTFKLEVLDKAEEANDQDVADEYGISRRTILNWRNKRLDIEAEINRKDINEKLVALDGELGAVAEYEKKYLDKLADLGELEHRKKVFVGGLEKVMWDHLSALDAQGAEDIKVDARVRMLKDLNEIREKLSGEPSVIMEYRNKFQMNVMMVVKEMIPERAEEFIERVKLLEE